MEYITANLKLTEFEFSEHTAISINITNDIQKTAKFYLMCHSDSLLMSHHIIHAI